MRPLWWLINKLIIPVANKVDLHGFQQLFELFFVLMIELINLKLFIMKKNMGTTDKTIRIFVAAIIAILYFTKVIDGTLAIVLLIFSAVFIITSLFSVCPLYPVFGMNTRKKD
jgi:hypothetical protein